jgi:hypothetical protein
MKRMEVLMSKTLQPNQPQLPKLKIQLLARMVQKEVLVKMAKNQRPVMMVV